MDQVRRRIYRRDRNDALFRIDRFHLSSRFGPRRTVAKLRSGVVREERGNFSTESSLFEVSVSFPFSPFSYGTLIEAVWRMLSAPFSATEEDEADYPFGEMASVEIETRAKESADAARRCSSCLLKTPADVKIRSIALLRNTILLVLSRFYSEVRLIIALKEIVGPSDTLD